MSRGYVPDDPSPRVAGLTLVVVLHVFLAWAVISATAHKLLDKPRQPPEAVVIQEVIIPNALPRPVPPQPPPPPEVVKPPRPKAPEPPKPKPPRVEPPKADAPRIEAPAPFIPRPEVALPAPAPAAAPAVPAPMAPAPVTPPAAAPAPIAPSAPTPAAPPAPLPSPSPTPTPTPARPQGKPDIAMSCPGQSPPEMPRQALRDGTQGVVKAQALIKDGVVKDVTIISGPRVFHAAVRQAMLRYKCTPQPEEVLAIQEFVFKIE